MGAQLRTVRRRIASVRSTAKITRAQELIASSRILRAQQRLHAAGPYDRELTAAVEALVSRESSVRHPMLERAEHPTRAAVLIVTSDRGFCGGFNATVLREAQRLTALLTTQELEPVLYVAGRKGITWHRFRGKAMEATWSGFSDTPAHSDAAGITQTLINSFSKESAEGGVDELHVVYTEFVSMLTQRAVLHRLLPMEIVETTQAPAGSVPAYDFEPSPEQVLDALLPAYIESRIYGVLLESAAAEIAARRRAMKSATDNANELIEQLTREANTARQAEITQEISEIVGGANALAEAMSGSRS